MKVIVAGSREIKDYAAVAKAIESSLQKLGVVITELVHGGARGVDRLAAEWAVAKGIPVRPFFAQWKSHGQAAGMIRNRAMGQYADILIAVWDGESRGTRHMIDVMHGLNKLVALNIVVRFSDRDEEL